MLFFYKNNLIEYRLNQGNKTMTLNERIQSFTTEIDAIQKKYGLYLQAVCSQETLGDVIQIRPKLNIVEDTNYKDNSEKESS